jgi:SRSO17 transposase
VPDKQDNCQVTVGVSLASEQASLPVDWQLYLPRHHLDLIRHDSEAAACLTGTHRFFAFSTSLHA